MTNSKPQKPDGGTIWRWALAIYWIALFAATHLPANFPALPGNRVDKLVHAAVYAVLAWLLATAWQTTTGKLNRRHLRAAWVVIALYAAVDELTQLLVGRWASVADWLADAAGAAIGLVVFAAARRKTG